jgi:hypothetical protein
MKALRKESEKGFGVIAGRLRDEARRYRRKAAQA